MIDKGPDMSVILVLFGIIMFPCLIQVIFGAFLFLDFEIFA